MNDQILDDKTRAEFPTGWSAEGGSLPAGQAGVSGGKKFFKNPKLIFGTIGLLILIFGIFWYFLFRSNAQPSPTSTNVLIFVKGPTQLTSDNEAEYHIVYRNGENADLVGISLEMFYPTGFKFKSATPTAVSSSGQTFNLPILKQGQDGEVMIRGKLSGSTGEGKEIKARLHYKLSNFNSEFLAEQSLITNILPPNLTMDVNGPVDVVNGQDATFIVSFTNVSSQDFDNLAVQLTYPAGFSFTSSNPPPTKNKNIWNISKLGANNTASIDITGSFTGDSSQDALVRADLGQLINNTFAPQIAATATFKIIPSSVALIIKTQQNNFVKLGDTINYTLQYANQGNIGLSNLVITIKLDGPALDLTHIQAQNAIITGNILTWKSATLSNLTVLSPTEKGEINFTVPVKSDLSTNLKNQTITASGSIFSDEIATPTKAANSELKLISSLGLTVNGNYLSGAAPMQVGKSTLFEMTFLLTNLSNDLSDTLVTASMPLSPLAWKNAIVPDSEKNRLSYDPNSGKIRWNIGTLGAFTGKFIPALKVSFQIEVTPNEADRGKLINLLGNVQATGTDTFVNLPIQTNMINSVSTSDIDDDVMNARGTAVQ